MNYAQRSLDLRQGGSKSRSESLLFRLRTMAELEDVLDFQFLFRGKAQN